MSKHIRKPSTAFTNVKLAKEEASANINEGDPIGQSLEAREQKLGGLANQVTDAEAKKKGIQLYRAAKLPTLKGPLEVDFIGKKKENRKEENVPKSVRGRPTPSVGKIAIPKTTSDE